MRPPHGSGHGRRIINSIAPVRICDNGGWTDTWFSGHGAVVNIGVYPYVEVQLIVTPADGERQVVVHAENYGERYQVEPGGEPLPGRHQLLQATLDALAIPRELSVEINIHSEVPAGCSTGTSASVTVAMVGALDCLTPGRMTLHETAYTAHQIESERLGPQTGIQDQMCAAFGGINFIEMDHYPRATVSRITVPNSLWWELEKRLVLVFLGRTHVSSDVHRRVIAELESEGPGSARLEALRRAARQSRDALYAGDLDALGRAMRENNEAQASLHPDLVSVDARRVIEIAAAYGASGWKVNGAGGEGGSLTLLGDPVASVRREMLDAIRAADPLFQPIPIYLSRTGLRVWES
jgi:D-glycero-alpha-D-manno-heptose-7-phosphate kinase